MVSVGATETAVVVAVPEAEPVVGSWRNELDPAAAWGVPAHVTVLYPFVPPPQLRIETVETLRSTVASVPAFRVTFAETGWFGDDVLWLAPEPAGSLRALTAAVWRAFPRHLPTR